MGAYEYQGSSLIDTIIFVDVDASSGANNGSSWPDAFVDLQDALAITAGCPSITTIWVATGTYHP
jgi:hypothetical protein